jgi:hypothetical protein
MKIKRVAISTIAVTGLLNASVLAQTSADPKAGSNSGSTQGNTSSASSGAASASNSQQQSSTSTQKSNKAPEGFVLVEERVVVLTANQPQNHFLRAQELLRQKDPKAAAGEVRMGAAYLDMQNSRGQGDQQLQQSADRLRELAGHIVNHQEQNQGQADQKKITDDSKQLDQAFAQANCSLAKHLQSLAKQELQNQKLVMAGHDLRSAAESLSAGYAWAGDKPSQDVSSAIQQSQQLAMQLMMPEDAGQQQQQQQQQSSATADNQDRAQTAGARIDQRSSSSAAAAPANASQTIEQLGTAIDNSRSTFKSAGYGEGQQNQQGQQSQNDQQGQQKQ